MKLFLNIFNKSLYPLDFQQNWQRLFISLKTWFSASLAVLRHRTAFVCRSDVTRVSVEPNRLKQSDRARLPIHVLTTRRRFCIKLISILFPLPDSLAFEYFLFWLALVFQGSNIFDTIAECDRCFCQIVTSQIRKFFAGFRGVYRMMWAKIYAIQCKSQVTYINSFLFESGHISKTTSSSCLFQFTEKLDFKQAI